MYLNSWEVPCSEIIIDALFLRKNSSNETVWSLNGCKRAKYHELLDLCDEPHLSVPRAADFSADSMHLPMVIRSLRASDHTYPHDVMETLSISREGSCLQLWKVHFENLLDEGSDFWFGYLDVGFVDFF